MAQIIPAFVINLERRPDRLARMEGHLRDRGVSFHAIAACDATTAAPETLDAVIHPGGPLGALGLGDRACTVSHTLAWSTFLETDASHGLFLEDDVWLSTDIAQILGSTDWVPAGAIKLEKFGDGASKLLLGNQAGSTPSGRMLRPMLSRHVGGGAYILDRETAQLALRQRGRMRVPVDHFLFNGNVSQFSRHLRPLITVPAMATQRVWDYNSDIAKHGKAARPAGLALRWRKLKRGAYEIKRVPAQALALATGRGHLIDVRYAEDADG